MHSDNTQARHALTWGFFWRTIVKFEQTLITDNPEFTMGCWRSTEGKWFLGVRTMLAGVRVSLLSVGRQWLAIDYCCGPDHGLAATTFVMVLTALHGVSEDVPAEEMQSLFPSGNYKPINRDPCWAVLHERAGIPRPAYRRCTLETCDRVTYKPVDHCPSCGSSLSLPQ
jgi:hypothetical protein